MPCAAQLKNAETRTGGGGGGGGGCSHAAHSNATSTVQEILIFRIMNVSHTAHGVVRDWRPDLPIPTALNRRLVLHPEIE